MPYFVKNDSLGLDDKLKWEKCDNTNDNKPKTNNVQILGIFPLGPISTKLGKTSLMIREFK